MKKLIYAAAIILTITGCDNRQAEVDNANRQKDSLAAIVNERDSALNDFLVSFNEIEVNLDSIARKQSSISVNIDKQGELNKTTKERINDNIASINQMMTANRNMIEQLNRKLKNSGAKIAHFEKMIQTLNEQIAQKDRELADLNDKLNGLNTQVAQLQTSVDTLTKVSASQAKTIDDQTTSLHTAYYVIGKAKDLEKMKVIDKTGGLLGIGKTPKLASTIDNEKFTRIDFTKMSSIPVGSKAKFVTTHPLDSYTLTKDAKNKDKVVSIEITNPEKFWSASKYLVVVKE